MRFCCNIYTTTHLIAATVTLLILPPIPNGKLQCLVNYIILIFFTLVATVQSVPSIATSEYLPKVHVVSDIQSIVF